MQMYCIRLSEYDRDSLYKYTTSIQIFLYRNLFKYKVYEKDRYLNCNLLLKWHYEKALKFKPVQATKHLKSTHRCR